MRGDDRARQTPGRTTTIRLAAALALGALSLAACGSGDTSGGDSGGTQADFVSFCESLPGSPSSQSCTCEGNWLQSHVSASQFSADLDRFKQGQIPQDVVSADVYCATANEHTP